MARRFARPLCAIPSVRRRVLPRTRLGLPNRIKSWSLTSLQHRLMKTGGRLVEDARRQYKQDRDPREPIFEFKRRTLVHFAVDTESVLMTTRLAGTATRFLPFNKGCDGAAGNPPDPEGRTYRTAYLWEEVLQRDSLLDLLARFIHLQMDEKRNDQGRKLKTESMIFPRWPPAAPRWCSAASNITTPEQQRTLVFLTNHLELAAATIAAIYQDRSQIELFFKALKQNLRVKTFVGTSANALKIQIWTALIAILLLRYLKLRARWGWSLANLVALLRQQLFVHRELFAWLDEPFHPPPGSEPEPPRQLLLTGMEA